MGTEISPLAALGRNDTPEICHPERSRGISRTKRLNGYLLPQQSSSAPDSLPPSRLARVILKKHPKIGYFGLHKPVFSVFMRAIRRAAEGKIGQKVARGATMFKRSRPAIYVLPLSGFSILSFCTGEIKKPPQNRRFWFT